MAEPIVSVVVVSFNSRDHLRACVEPLSNADDVRVIVVDNASTDGCLEALAGLDVTIIPCPSNGGFARGCNVGWETSASQFVLFLNPDTRMETVAILRMVDVLRENEKIGAVGPKILNTDGSLAFSLRRYPRLSATYARALFLHRIFPRASWTDEVIRDPRVYGHAHAVEWASGACLLVRRAALERLGGLDEGFFMYREDTDLCRRLWTAGFEVWYEPESVCVHVGGASAPRPLLLPVATASQIRYARKHGSSAMAALERGGLILEALTHVVVTRGGRAARAGRLRALGALVRPGTGAVKQET